LETLSTRRRWTEPTHVPIETIWSDGKSDSRHNVGVHNARRVRRSANSSIRSSSHRPARESVGFTLTSVIIGMLKGRIYVGVGVNADGGGCTFCFVYTCIYILYYSRVVVSQVTGTIVESTHTHTHTHTCTHSPVGGRWLDHWKSTGTRYIIVVGGGLRRSISLWLYGGHTRTQNKLLSVQERTHAILQTSMFSRTYTLPSHVHSTGRAGQQRQIHR